MEWPRPVEWPGHQKENSVVVSTMMPVTDNNPVEYVKVIVDCPRTSKYHLGELGLKINI